MALFSDGNISTLDDLGGHDSSVLDMANVEGLDLGRKLALAQEEMGLELSSALNTLAGPDWPIWSAPRLGLENVVVTPALKLWHAMRTLEAAYSDAYGSQLNDRYKARRDQYHEQARWAKEKVLELGVGLVPDPVAQAGQPTMTGTSGLLTEATYYVAVSWVNERGAEGASSVAATIAVPQAGGFAVTAPPAPMGAAGWNVFIGMSADRMVIQNRSLMLPDEQWVQGAMPASLGRLAGTGQPPTWIRPLPRLLRRG